MHVAQRWWPLTLARISVDPACFVPPVTGRDTSAPSQDLCGRAPQAVLAWAFRVACTRSRPAGPHGPRPVSPHELSLPKGPGRRTPRPSLGGKPVRAGPPYCRMSGADGGGGIRVPWHCAGERPSHGNNPLSIFPARTFSTPIAMAAVRFDTFWATARVRTWVKALSSRLSKRLLTSASVQNKRCRS